MVLFKKLDQYLLRYFLMALLVVIIALGFTIIIINMVEELRDFVDNQVPFLTIVEYYTYFAGWVIKSFFPLFVLLGALFGVSLLARNKELLAMKACGRSLYRITAPIFIMALLLAAAHFYYNEYIFPPANERRLEIKNFEIERKSRESYARVSRITRQISPGNFYTLSSFNTNRHEGADFKLYNTTRSELTRIITSRLLLYRDGRWLAVQGVERIFGDNHRETFNQFDSLYIDEIRDTPSDLERRIGKPEDMSLEEIRYYIDLMKRTGGPYIQELVNLHLKFSYPLTSAIVILICVPFAANPRRGGIAVSFATGALIALVYFVLFRIMQSAGYNEKVPVWFAAWGVNGVFFLIGLFSMITARK
ncbi:LptF/LptG family permease [candidate division GN15 bacterium]|nr:LptF/LptG family permease [candidate division GN15 bacterium]